VHPSIDLVIFLQAKIPKPSMSAGIQQNKVTEQLVLYVEISNDQTDSLDKNMLLTTLIP